MKKLFALALILWIVQLVNAQAPTISSFTPSSGPVGTLVTITGTNLSSPSAFSVGGVSAIAVSNSGTSLVGMVMPGAATGAVSVTTAGGTATSGSSFTVSATPYPAYQQGNKLVGTGNIGAATQGSAVSVSADGNTAIVGAEVDNTQVGAAWVYTRNGSTWSQQGGKLVGTGIVGTARFGVSVALSADGNTAIVGGLGDNGGIGAAWVFTRSAGVWSQQGSKLVGTGSVGTSFQGVSVGMSADGNTAVIGGGLDNSSQGAAWVFTRSGSVWSQQGSKLVGTGSIGQAEQGWTVALSADGNTALLGGRLDNSATGAVWVFTRSGGVWNQQGAKLTGTGAIGAALQGTALAISADGNTAIIGGSGDNSSNGAAWVFTRSGTTWSQQGSKLVGSGATGTPVQGVAVALSADGNTSLVGGFGDNSNAGATWVFTRSGSVWSQQGSKLVGTGNVGAALQSTSTSISADGKTAVVGGIYDNSNQGAAWVFSHTPYDYTITNAGGNVIITDIAGNSETLTFDNPSLVMRFSVTGRTYSLNGGATTNLPYTFTSLGLNSITINTNVGDDIINVSTITANLPSLTINGGVGNDIVNFNGDITFLANANLDVDLQNDDATPGDDVVNLALNTDLVLSGTGAATIKVSKNVFGSLNSTIKSDNGNITIEANQQAVPTSGTFYGFRLSSARVEINGSGVLTIKGKGGNIGTGCQGITLSGSSQVKGGSAGTTTLEGIGNSAGSGASGIVVDASSIIQTTGSSLTINGHGGNGTSATGVAIAGEVRAGGTGDVDISGEGGDIVGSGNAGVSCLGATALIRTVDGDVTVTGIGKGSGGTSAGVNMGTGAQIYAGGSGNTLVQGTGGNGGNSKGVLLGSANTTITSSGGNVSVIGLGNTALTTTGDNYGVQLINGGKITAGGTGAVSVQGTAGTATGNQNFGIFLSGATSQITSGGGNVAVSGFGGGSGASTQNYGVYIVADTKIDAGVNGTVTVSGTGEASNGDNNDGIFLSGNNALITSNGGNVTVNGFGGGSPTASGGQDGIYLQSGGQIIAGGNGVTTVNGTGGTSALNTNIGVFVFNGGLISSNGGNVLVNGTGGTGSSDNIGVYVAGPGQITAGGMGDVSVTGVGTGSDSRGVVVMGIGTQIYSSGGDVNVTGTGGTVSFSNNGVDVFGVISAGGLGNVTVVGNGGASPSNVNIGVSVSGFGATITSEGGDIAVTGSGGGIGASENNYGVFLSGGNGVVGVGNGTVTVNGTGGPSTGVNNHGVVVNGALFITSAGGDIEVYGQKGVSSPSAKGVVLETGGGITSTGTGANINIKDVGGFYPVTQTVDVTTTSTKTLTLSSTSTLIAAINGLTANTQYVQLNVVGQVAINNAGLVFTGSTHTPLLGQSFIIINNDGTDAVTGTFNGLAQGAIITNFLGSSLSAQISYVGGTGNDVVLTVVATSNWYLDADGDGYYVSGPVASVSSPGTGWTQTVTASGDCDDNDPTKYTTFTFYLDADGDGYGVKPPVAGICAVNALTPPTGYSTNGDDCNDSNPAINPTTTWFKDSDNDNYYILPGVKQCTSPGPTFKYTGLLGIDCDDNDPTLTTFCGSFVWLGNSTDWHTNSNWSTNAVPNSCSADVVIPVTSNNPTILTPISVRNIQMDGLVKLTLNAPLTVCGKVKGGASFPATVEEVGINPMILQGSINQAIEGNLSIARLRLNNSTGAVMLSSSIRIGRAMELQTGDFKINGQSLKFSSTSATDYAILDNFTSGYTGTLTGSATAERFVPTTGINQHYIGSPVINTSFAQLGATNPTGGFVIPTPNCDQSQTANNSPYGNIFQWHDNTPANATCLYNGWEVKTSSGTAQAGRGYSVYLPNGTFSITGQLNQGNSYNVSVPGSYASWESNTLQTVGTIPAVYKSGWHMVSNPFLAPIQLSGHTPDFTSAAVWVTSGPFSGSYQPVNITGGQIPPFQGFIVRRSSTTAPGVDFTFDKSECITTPGIQFYKTASEHQLSVQVSGNGFNDITRVEFNSATTNAFDVDYDAFKPMSALGQPTLSSFNTDITERLAINVNKSIAETPNVQLNFVPGNNGTFSFTVDGINTFDPTSYVTLEDTKEGTMTDLRQNPTYTFAALKTDNHNRFVLHFTPAAAITTVNGTCTENGTLSVTQDGPADWNYTITSSNDTTTIAAGTLNSTSPINQTVPMGTYQITLTDNSGYQVIKNVQVNGQTPIAAATMTASTTTVEEDQPITLINTTSNTTTEWNFGDGNTATTNTADHTYTEPGIYTVTLTVTNADGCTATTTQTITVTEKLNTGITTTTKESIHIYPNPASTKLNINLSKVTTETKLTLTNALGQTIQTLDKLKQGVNTIDVSQLAEGLYLITVNEGKAVLTTQRIVISQ